MKYVIVGMKQNVQIIETIFCLIINVSHLKNLRILIKKILKFRSKMTKDRNRKYFDVNKYTFFGKYENKNRCI
jgi:hypothetical protein